MRKQFDIKYRPQIESGEYKVETRSGQTARIVCWDRVGSSLVVLIGKDELVLTYNSEGTTGQEMQLPSDLFIVTPEEELSEFEKAVYDCVWVKVTNKSDGETKEEYAKRNAAELLALARKQLLPEIEKAYKNVDKIVYENGVLYGKAEALKDLPRWKNLKRKCNSLDNYPCVGISMTGEDMLYCGDKCISIKSLEKLPGFKED